MRYLESKILRRFLRRRLAVTGAMLVLFVIGMALLGPYFVTHDPVKMNIRGALQPPGNGHLLGTDHRGRDTLARLAYGAGISLKVGLMATGIALVVGVGLGAASGYLGGLVDTVFDKDYSDKPLHERNGFVFHDADAPGLESALHRAIALYYHYPEHFRHLMINGMRSDYSWNHPGQHYLNIYDYIRDR